MNTIKGTTATTAHTFKRADQRTRYKHATDGGARLTCSTVALIVAAHLLLLALFAPQPSITRQAATCATATVAQ